MCARLCASTICKYWSCFMDSSLMMNSSRGFLFYYLHYYGGYHTLYHLMKYMVITSLQNIQLLICHNCHICIIVTICFSVNVWQPQLLFFCLFVIYSKFNRIFLTVLIKSPAKCSHFVCLSAILCVYRFLFFFFL